MPPSSGTSTFGPSPRWVKAARRLFLGDLQGVRVDLMDPYLLLCPAEMLGHIPRPPDPPLPGTHSPSPPSSPPGLTVSALSWDHLPDSYTFPRPYSGSVFVKATNFQVFNATAVPAAHGQAWCPLSSRNQRWWGGGPCPLLTGMPSAAACASGSHVSTSKLLICVQTCHRGDEQHPGLGTGIGTCEAVWKKWFTEFLAPVTSLSAQARCPS